MFGDFMHLREQMRQDYLDHMHIFAVQRDEMQSVRAENQSIREDMGVLQRALRRIRRRQLRAQRAMARYEHTLQQQEEATKRLYSRVDSLFELVLSHLQQPHPPAA